MVSYRQQKHQIDEQKHQIDEMILIDNYTVPQNRLDQISYDSLISPINYSYIIFPLPYIQWEFQDPKMKLLYHIRRDVVVRFPAIITLANQALYLHIKLSLFLQFSQFKIQVQGETTSTKLVHKPSYKLLVYKLMNYSRLQLYSL